MSSDIRSVPDPKMLKIYIEVPLNAVR